MKWVPDGLYDSIDFDTRYLVQGGYPRIVLSKMWIESGIPDHLDPKFGLPWGTYPNLPPKPPRQ